MTDDDKIALTKWTLWSAAWVTLCTYFILLVSQCIL